ncbi:hypothetical protein BGZ76_005302, partial [Entomortierella beljakovae]
MSFVLIPKLLGWNTTSDATPTAQNDANPGLRIGYERVYIPIGQSIPEGSDIDKEYEPGVSTNKELYLMKEVEKSMIWCEGHLTKQADIAVGLSLDIVQSLEQVDKALAREIPNETASAKRRRKLQSNVALANTHKEKKAKLAVHQKKIKDCEEGYINLKEMVAKRKHFYELVDRRDEQA